MSSTPTATFGLLLPAVGLRCLVTAAILGCGPGAGLAYGPRWEIFVSGSGDGLMATCGDCSVAAHSITRGSGLERRQLRRSARRWRDLHQALPGPRFYRQVRT